MILIVNQLCRTKQSNMNQNKENTSNIEIIDPITEIPYTVKYDNKTITLPENLGGKNVQGYAFIELVIDNKVGILETSITKLSLSDKNKNKIIEYNISQGKLPPDLKKYAIFFDDYCKKEIILEKRQTSQLTNLTQFKLQLRLNIE